MGGRHRATPPNRSRALGQLVHGVVGLLVLAALALSVAVAGLPIAVRGSVLIVHSGSMAPALVPGDVAVTRPLPVAEIAVGDVITFRAGDPRGAAGVAIRRVSGIEPGPAFRTRGDANPNPDPTPVAAADVRGVLWYRVPWVGWAAERLASPAGAVIGAGVVALAVGAVLLVGGGART